MTETDYLVARQHSGCFLPVYRCLKITEKFKTFFPWYFTNLSWETMKYISSPDTIPTESFQDQKEARKREEQAGRRKNTTYCSSAYTTTMAAIILILVMLFQLSFIMIGLVAQLMTCFRRDWLSTNLSAVLIHKTSKEKLQCDDKVEVMTGLLIPDVVIFSLAFWLYFVLKFGSPYYSCCKFCGFKGLKTVMKADTPETLNILVQAAKDKLIESYVTVTYTLIPIIYICLSAAVSYGYLRAFKVAYDDVVIQPPLGGPILGGEVKNGTITLSFIGFVALDLLYLRVMLMYAYPCQLVIYHIKLIKDEVTKYKRNTHQNQDIKTELMNKTENSNTFIKELNARSSTTAILIIIAGFQAVNCAINLLNELSEISYKQAVVVFARLLLWGFLLGFPCYKTAEVNRAGKRLQDIWQDVNRNSAAHNNGNSGPIILEATMFGFSVPPRLPFLVPIVLLFIIMTGAQIKWYQLLKI